MCAAPGGKSILLQSLGFNITAIDKSQIQSPKKIKHKKPVKGLKYHNKNSKAVKKENE